ncbi:MAG TPA: hypothetical protein PLV68_16085 [Ilumatobacteraceae bacterium]|nr:hypothetical protein [Ilumatobacteraceae bacterium]
MSIEIGNISVQYRVSFGKKDEVVEGADDAHVVLTVAAADCGLDPAVAFMRGKLKSAGSTGAFFALLADGSLGPTLRRLASR